MVHGGMVGHPVMGRPGCGIALTSANLSRRALTNGRGSMETDAQRALLNAELFAQRARQHAYMAFAWSVIAIAIALIALVAAIASAI